MKRKNTKETGDRERIPHTQLQQLVSSVPKSISSVVKMKGDVTQWKTCSCPNFFLERVADIKINSEKRKETEMPHS